MLDGELIGIERKGVRVDGAHPMMRWMWHFDHQKFEHLVAWDAPDPVYGAGMPQAWHRADWYFDE